jgi:hypothetical protein
LVEGPDDKHVVIHLRERSTPDCQFDISDKGGKDPLLTAIGNEVRVPGRQAVGILIDANDDVRSRWQAVVDRLVRVNITPPDSPDPSGTIIDGRPRVGIWLMPNNVSTGELEEFVEGMIPDDDPVWPLSQHYVDGIPAGDRKFRDGKILRAKVHAWLATREEPRKMGVAIKAGDLNVDALGAVQLVAWLRRLFG